MLRILAGVPDGAPVDLWLMKLPDSALMFPTSARRGLFSCRITRAKHRDKCVSVKVKSLGFPGLRLHDLRGSHETLLLDSGTPIHVVAEHCGHDPAVTLRRYAKRTRKADSSAAAIMGQLLQGPMG